jgi:immune inhibitor A
MKRNIFSLAMVLALLLIMVVPLAGASAPNRPEYDDPTFVAKVDHRMDPLTKKQDALRLKGWEAKLNGKTQGGVAYKVEDDEYVELEREGEDPVWTVLGEFADYPHNSVAEPDRTVDNTTIWVPDFNRDYYLGMLFNEGDGVNSMRQYYIEQSSNRYAVYGDVTDWSSLPGDACEYDDGDPGPGNAQSVWQFLIDSTAVWYDNQIAAGMTPAEIDAYLSQFDVWDRYDWDGDGNFDEPDGYIDHMQFVHSGEGNEAGGGDLGDCAIWSHSWFAYSNLVGIEGPSPEFLIGGVQIGESSFWLNKYTIQPMNGGVGVFAHEFGHDLGLPDLYDYTGENATGFWTIMSSGSWLSQNDYDIGSQPDHFGIWEKFQLGWLDYDVAFWEERSVHKLGPAEKTSRNRAQGLFVVLPDKPVTEQIEEPYEGEYFYYSGAGNDLDNWMTKSFNLAAGSTLNAMANVQIEVDWDYAYLVVSTDGGATWDNVETNLSTNSDPNGQNFGNGITGNSHGWVPLTADLSAYTGDVMLGFRYWTDVAAVEPGFMVDNIEISGYPLDGAEADTGWNFTGFSRTTGTESAFYFNAYVVENRQYLGFDEGLANAYNFGWGGDPVLFNWVERFPYQDGLLISYWDTSFPNNNVTARCFSGARCGGLLLPVDAHPDLMYRADGGIWRNRIQTYDATFGLEPTDAITLHWRGGESFHPSQPAVRMFDDTISYWNADNPNGSVQVPNTGTRIVVTKVRGKTMIVKVLGGGWVRPPK